LVEIAEVSKTSIWLEEDAVPIQDQVRAVCELLGFDPLHVACEGRFVAIVPPEQVTSVLNAMHVHPLGGSAQRIGVVREGEAGLVVLRNRIGTERIVDMLSGEQLPRIC
jgi:hydrogenase expression/formation protein HypE